MVSLRECSRYMLTCNVRQCSSLKLQVLTRWNDTTVIMVRGQTVTGIVNMTAVIMDVTQTDCFAVDDIIKV